MVELDVAALTGSQVRQGEVLGVGPDGLAGMPLELVLQVGAVPGAGEDLDVDLQS